MIWNGPMGVFEFEAFAKVRGHRSGCLLVTFLGILSIFSFHAENNLGCDCLQIADISILRYFLRAPFVID